jgi:type I restriction enzyme, S subunit
MKKYDSYKDSGVDWIGEIPSNWEKTRLRFTGRLYGGLTGKSGDDFNQDDNPNNKPYIPYTNIFNNTYISKNHFHYVVLQEGEKQNKVKKFDMFFLMSSETHQDLGKPCILIEDVDELYLNSFCKGFRIDKDYLNPLFLNYQLLGQVHKELISVEGRGFTRINLRQDRLNNSPLFIPPLHEQQQIVQFLDTKTSLIDTLIEKTQRKIELLKEKRTSLINHVVTKGLNPNVEMKDSGVEWIGNIPCHWEIGKLKNYSNLKISSVDKHILEEERKVIVCNYTDVYYNEFITSKLELRKGSCSENEYTNFLLNKGDVIITKDSESPTDIGVPSLVNDDLDNVVCGYHLSIIKPHKTKLVGNYLFRQLQTKRIRSYFEITSNGITRFGLGKSSVLETILILPPYSEQQQIVEYLDEQTQIIDTIITKEQKRIKLIKEYRQSLISEVVTGKIKVTTDE